MHRLFMCFFVQIIKFLTSGDHMWWIVEATNYWDYINPFISPLSITALQGCSAETWSINGPLRVLGLYWAHGSWVPDSSPEPSCKSLDRSCAEAFVGNFRAWVRICISARCNPEPPGNPCGLLGVYSVYSRFRDMPFCDGCHVLSVSSWSLALVEDQIPMCARAHMQFRDKPFLWWSSRTESV
jgi:hypothetical protein